MRRQFGEAEIPRLAFATPGWSMPSGDRRMNRFCGKTFALQHRPPAQNGSGRSLCWDAPSAVNRRCWNLALPISEEALPTMVAGGSVRRPRPDLAIDEPLIGISSSRRQ